jgi:hypothetical protein
LVVKLIISSLHNKEMKKGICLLFVAGLALGASGLAYAQTAKGVLTEEHQAIVRQHGTELIQRLTQVLAQQQDLGMRLSSRIQKMEASGIDMTAAKAKLAEGQNA